MTLPTLPFRRVAALASVTGAVLLAACSPKYDWRETNGVGAPYVATFPAKPSTDTRTVDLDGVQVKMTMTTAEVDGAMFAVGTAELPAANQVPAALAAMKTAMVKNISGQVKRDRPLDQVPGSSTANLAGSELEAIGSQQSNGKAQALLLVGRFVAQEKRVYQVIVLGREQSMPREQVDTFLTSFKLSR